MGDDYLEYQIYEDARAREEILAVFVILTIVSILLGLGFGQFLNQAGKERIPGAKWFALIFGSALGGVIGLLAAKATQTSISGMALVGASILGLTAAHRTCASNVSPMFVFGFIWIIGGIILWLSFHGAPASRFGTFQLLAYAGIVVGIAQILGGAVRVRKSKIFNLMLVSMILFLFAILGIALAFALQPGSK